MSSELYKPMTDDVIATLQHSVIRPTDLYRLKEQGRRANALAEAVQNLFDFKDPDPNGERRLLRELRLGDAFRAYFGDENNPLSPNLGSVK